MYKLTAPNYKGDTDCIKRLSDNAFITTDPTNTDYANYLVWLAEGNTPEPYIEPVKTLEQQAEEVRVALQSAIDGKAKTFNFSSGNALMLYAGFTNPFQALAQTFAVWEASVWFEAETYRQEVIAGAKPMLTPAEAVALMPEYPTTTGN